MAQLQKTYDPKQTEPAIQAKWLKGKVFAANAASDKEAYSISMPPPNATGHLHIGHAVRMTVEDMLARQARLAGKEVLWLPGTDHAAIATESVVIRNLQKEEGIKDPRTELGRTDLVQRIADYVENSRGVIRSQIKQLGASCDWSRERYTLEPALSRIVSEVFKKMYEDGLIYRGMRIVNWDPKLQTTVSDDEVEYQQETTTFYTFQYGPFQISTARPETKFGDKYVVMHPNDSRYTQYKHGDTFEAEWINGPVTATIIKDDRIDPEFGTGVMTITPWHDATDFDIAERHSLDKEQIIGYDGRLLKIAGEFAGLKIEEARPQIIDKLKAKGLLVSAEEGYEHNIAVNSRGKGVIEPQIKLQWFVDVNKRAVNWQGQQMSLKEVMQDVVRSGHIELYPKRYEKLYFHWIDNLRDWCISRQIWWGHRVPVWYKGEEIYVGHEAPPEKGYEQDPDTLDTWFSSALWTWSTLIDPALTANPDLSLEDMLAQSPDFKKFHPTSVLETGYDIIFFWVARMVLMTTYATGQVPFRHVFLNGLITTKDGKKMSKSDPASIINPLDMIETYGADAVRFSLIYQLSYGSQAIKFDEEAIKNGRNFMNKVWNVARLLLTMPERTEETVADQWIKARLAHTAAAMEADIAKYRLGEAAHTIYDFLWKDFADWYLEIVKTEGSTAVAKQVFAQALQLLHPLTPHITEKLWEHFGSTDFLATTIFSPPRVGGDEEGVAPAVITRFQSAVSTVRSARSLLDITPGQTIDVFSEEELPLPAAFSKMTFSQVVAAKTAAMKPFPLVTGGLLYIGGTAINEQAINAAISKLGREQQVLEQDCGKLQAIIANMAGKAPADKIAAKEQELAAAKDRLAEIKRSLELLN